MFAILRRSFAADKTRRGVEIREERKRNPDEDHLEC